MKILILEDSQERIDSFKENLVDHQVIVTGSTKEAIIKLKTETWDVLFLDHDLHGESYIDSGENTGYEVAKFLEENKDRMPRYVIIHSLNPVGSNNMEAALPNAVKIPFAWTMAALNKIGLRS